MAGAALQGQEALAQPLGKVHADLPTKKALPPTTPTSYPQLSRLQRGSWRGGGHMGARCGLSW